MNKLIFYSIAALVFIVSGLSLNIKAQEAEITIEQYDAMRDKYLEILERVPYKTKSKNAVFLHQGNDLMLEEESSYENEYDEKGNNRSVFLKTENGKIIRTETIQIGKSYYKMDKDGFWTRETKGDMFSLVSGSRTSSDQIKARYIGEENVSNIATKVYRELTKRNFEFPDGTKFSTQKIETVWIDPQGRVMRSKSESSRSDDSRKFETTLNYEYPKSIKITAPRVRAK